MSVRYSVVESLIAHISSTTGFRGYRGLKFLHEINEFPSFYIHVAREQRAHVGAGMKIGIITCDLRVYEYSDSIDTLEIVLRAIESSIDSFTNNCVADEIRVLTVRTDEGLAIPYQVGDITLQIIYRIE